MIVVIIVVEAVLAVNSIRRSAMIMLVAVLAVL